jgi:hypothetical protein
VPVKRVHTRSWGAIRPETLDQEWGSLQAHQGIGRSHRHLFHPPRQQVAELEQGKVGVFVAVTDANPDLVDLLVQWGKAQDGLDVLASLDAVEGGQRIVRRYDYRRARSDIHACNQFSDGVHYGPD